MTPGASAMSVLRRVARLPVEIVPCTRSANAWCCAAAYSSVEQTWKVVFCRWDSFLLLLNFNLSEHELSKPLPKIQPTVPEL